MIVHLRWLKWLFSKGLFLSLHTLTYRFFNVMRLKKTNGQSYLVSLMIRLFFQKPWFLCRKRAFNPKNDNSYWIAFQIKKERQILSHLWFFSQPIHWFQKKLTQKRIHAFFAWLLIPLLFAGCQKQKRLEPHFNTNQDRKIIELHRTPQTKPLSIGIFLPQNSQWKTCLIHVLEFFMHEIQNHATHPTQINYWFFQDDGTNDSFNRACAFFQEKQVVGSWGLSAQKSDLIPKKSYWNVLKEAQSAPYKHQLIYDTAAEERDACLFLFHDQSPAYKALRRILRSQSFPEERLWYYRLEGDKPFFFHPEFQSTWSSEIPEFFRSAKTFFIETKPIKQAITGLSVQMEKISDRPEGVVLISLDPLSSVMQSHLSHTWIYPEREQNNACLWEKYQNLYGATSASQDIAKNLLEKLAPLFQEIAREPRIFKQGFQDWNLYFWSGGKQKVQSEEALKIDRSSNMTSA